jgi:hypothetical protein
MNKQKKVITIEAILNRISDIEIPTPPSFKDYLGSEANECFSEIARAIKIIREYNTGERIYDAALVTQDAAILAAIHSGISEQVGFMQGLSSRAESVRRVVKSNYVLELKRVRDKAIEDGEPIKCTENDIDHASRTLSQDAYLNQADAETISRMLSAAWYSINDFVKVLNTVIRRAERE